MIDLPLQTIFAWTIAAQFGALGVLNLVAPEPFLDQNFHWNYPRCDRRVSGVMEISVALLLVFDATFNWGMALAVLVTFGGVVMLLCASKYFYALTGIGFFAFLFAGFFLLQAGLA